MSEELTPMQPIVILPKGGMSQADIARLRKTGITVVEAEDPDKVRFCEPPPMGYEVYHKAALDTFRHIISDKSENHASKATVAQWYIHFLRQYVKL